MIPALPLRILSRQRPPHPAAANRRKGHAMCFRPPAAVESPTNCLKCGAEVPVGAARCPSCGAASQVPAVHAPGVPAAPKAPGAPGAPTPPPAPRA
ncbi:zinc-ribbon domain-containing protein [Gordonibacter pamelaeae]|uniref:zinc-ribbon domain-containing protein n=2 Tax=Gordonibacter pamelaeae TaxID=471189 RepID=UPI0039F4A3C8